METNQPLISVVMTTYNHEKYIAEAINSVLEQTFKDFELIIINDGSTDKTDEIIKTFLDNERIVYINQENQGTSTATNNGILAAKGKYVALFSGDDVFYSQKLEKQWNFINQYNSKIVFSLFDVIDDNSNIKFDPVIDTWFIKENISREELINIFFFKGNCVNAVTAIIDKECLLDAGLFNPASIQAQDFDMWVKLIKRYKISILTEKLVKYRIRDNNQNLSNLTNSVRTYFELNQIYKTIFDALPIEIFRKAFFNKLKKQDFTSNTEYELEKAFVYLNHYLLLVQNIGSEKLFNLLQDGNILTIAKKEYDFGLPELYALTKKMDITNVNVIQESQIKLELSQSQRQQIQAELELSQSQRQQIQAELELSQSQLQQIQAELELSQSQRQQMQAELELSQSQHQQIQAELELSQSQRQQIQAELELSQSQHQQIQIELERLQVQLQQSQKSLRAIETSKFWKLRSLWFKFRKYIGITDDTESITLKSLLNSVKPKYKTISIKQKEWHQNKPLVSVIIPCFNYGHYVEEAIDSVLNQTFSNLEIIVVDGGSTDAATITTLKSLKKPRTKIYFREGRHFVGDNRNFGIERAKGKYICCLDADDKLKPTYIEKALFLLENYAYDLVSTSVQCFGSSDSTWFIVPNPRLDEIIKGNQISTVAVFAKKAWKKANGYHDYGIGKEHIHEDWDLWVRMIALGARTINIHEPLMLYRIHSKSSLSNHPEIVDYEKQAETISRLNKKYLTSKNYALSLQRNEQKIKVLNGTINLVNSYNQENQKINILFALPFVITGGADNILLQVAKHLSDNGCNISVMTTIKADISFGDNTHRYEQITQEIYHLYNFLESADQWKEFIYYFIESRKIDLILIVGSAYFYSILPDIKINFPNIKVVDQLFNEYGHINNNRKYAEYIDIHVVENESVERCLINEHKEQKDKVILIHNGVDTNYFNPKVVKELSIDNQLIPKNKFIVSFLGRFSEEKGPDLFVEIVNKLKEDDNFYFVMAGNGPMYGEIIELINKYQLSDKIYLPGFVDTRECLSFSNVVVIPSRIDGRPNVALESLSMGVPVIASSVGGLPTIIQNRYNGILCEMENIDEFVETIKNLRVKDEYINNLKINARDYAIKNLSITKMHKKYLDEIISLVK